MTHFLLVFWNDRSNTWGQNSKPLSRGPTWNKEPKTAHECQYFTHIVTFLWIQHTSVYFAKWWTLYMKTNRNRGCLTWFWPQLLGPKCTQIHFGPWPLGSPKDVASDARAKRVGHVGPIRNNVLMSLNNYFLLETQISLSFLSIDCHITFKEN